MMISGEHAERGRESESKEGKLRESHGMYGRSGVDESHWHVCTMYMKIRNRRHGGNNVTIVTEQGIRRH